VGFAGVQGVPMDRTIAQVMPWSRKMQDHAESLGCHCVECQRTMPSPAMQMS